MPVRPKHDTLGDRMKGQYENRTRFSLPRRTYTILRVDGRAFHTWTRGLNKPYDVDFMDLMDIAAIKLCEEVAGARFAFVQSDEISILATDFQSEDSEAWFDGNLQKWTSVSSSIATMAFNLGLMRLKGDSSSGNELAITKKFPNAVFDARVFTIPDYIEVANYFIWRQKDAERNSVTLLASAYASHKQLHGKSVADRHDIIHNAGDNWAKHPVRFKHGAVIRPRTFLTTHPKDATISVERSEWVVDRFTPVFTKDKNYLSDLIPQHWAVKATGA